MPAYYNEHDPYAAAWLRNLISAGHIAPGDVDERSIEDVLPIDLMGYDQCHFFAGIGVWSYALRQAGWPDDKPVWTGSCPCQPFSAAGKGAGTADERHLWPAWFHLIAQCRPVTVFGEQVDAAIRQGWLDLVQADLEGIGYTVGATVLPAAGFGAPHIRSRLWFVADTNLAQRRAALAGRDERHGHSSERDESNREFREHYEADSMADHYCERCHGQHALLRPVEAGRLATGLSEAARNSEADGDGMPGPTNGIWRSADWLLCRDNKWRPVEPGLEPLAHGAPARVGRLRAYGNAICAPVAAAFVSAYLGGF